MGMNQDYLFIYYLFIFRSLYFFSGNLEKRATYDKATLKAFIFTTYDLHRNLKNIILSHLMEIAFMC